MLGCVTLFLLVTGTLSLDLNSKQRSANKREDQYRELWRHTTFQSGHNMLSDFHPQHLYGENSMSACPDPAHHSPGHVLCVHYDKGSYTQSGSGVDRGGGFYAPLSTHTVMMLSYDIYFSSNFDFVKGGKLPGLWGGSYTCTGGRHSEDCFTTRFMWRSGGEGEVYAYVPRQQESGFCDRDDVHCNFDYGNSLGRGKWTFRKGVWQNIAQYVHLNTPGHTDGYMRVYLNGNKVYEIRNVAFRTKDSVQIRGFVFSTFFGGSDSSWASTQSCYTYYKNFVLSMDSTHPVMIG